MPITNFGLVYSANIQGVSLNCVFPNSLQPTHTACRTGPYPRKRSEEKSLLMTIFLQPITTQLW